MDSESSVSRAPAVVFGLLRQIGSDAEPVEIAEGLGALDRNPDGQAGAVLDHLIACFALFQGLNALVGEPHYETIRFAIFQFEHMNDDWRNPILHTDDGVTLFSIDDLETMVSATYELWRDVCEEREMEARRKASGTRGPLI